MLGHRQIKWRLWNLSKNYIALFHVKRTKEFVSELKIFRRFDHYQMLAFDFVILLPTSKIIVFSKPIYCLTKIMRILICSKLLFSFIQPDVGMTPKQANSKEIKAPQKRNGTCKYKRGSSDLFLPSTALYGPLPVRMAFVLLYYHLHD